jgi:hypothetical protein
MDRKKGGPVNFKQRVVRHKNKKLRSFQIQGYENFFKNTS